MAAALPPSRLQVAQRLAAHLGHRDFDEVADLLSQEVTYRVRGSHALAGTFHGPDEVIAHVRQLVDRTDDTYDAFKWDDWLVGDYHVVALFRVHAHGHGAAYAGRILLLFGFDPAEKISQITVFFDDEGGAERFFGQ
jgi:ketosteroid isomerase-like protein